MAFKIAGRRRQHGADDEGRHDRKKECLRDIEHRDDGDDEQADQGDSDHFRAPDHRRLIVGALRNSLADRRFQFLRI